MRKWTVGLFSLALVSATGAAFTQLPAHAATPAGQSASVEAGAVLDELPNPLEDKRRDAREIALNMVLNGKAKVEKRGGSSVVKIGQKSVRGAKGKQQKVDQYVELSREKTDKIFVVLAEFGDQRHPSYPDQDTAANVPGPTRFDGPLNNQIPEPDRTKNNSTVWQPNYDRQHYQDMYFGSGDSLKTYYEKQSSGRYSVDGQVTDWVKVPYNEARYGRSNGYPCASNVCSNTWYLIKDALTAWVADQQAQGRTTDQIKADLQSFDQWDRYDYDGDGNFNEPDGYIDHFQIVHAGGDQADGDPIQGEDAIWSHRWYNFSNNIGRTGPAGNLLGGSPIGDTGLWVGDYTIQPENGGLSVFTHEYGHDLGLPDHYDTSGPNANGENPVNWWTLMAQSRVSAKDDQGIGTRPADLGAWDKLQLGWLNYDVTVAGSGKKKVDLGPHEYNTTKKQAEIVVLPKKQVTIALPTPAEGAKQWWSGAGDDLNTTLTRDVTLPAGTATLSFKANWDIEDCGPDACDYAFVEVNDGSGWTAIPGSITTAAEGNGIDGTSDGYQPATFDLSAYAGKTISLRFRYSTDGAVGGQGFFADDITITAGGQTVLSDGAENGDNGWTAAGFSAVGSSMVKEYNNYYIASNRVWTSFDQYLQTGPYNFGDPSRPNWVQHFPYQQGLLITYWDTSYSDNNTSQHPGAGLILPIDAHPKLIARADGSHWRPRVQAYDAPFSLTKADSFSLDFGGVSNKIQGAKAQPVFDDGRSYYDESAAEGIHYGVKVPNNGVRIKVMSQDGTSMTIEISNR